MKVLFIVPYVPDKVRVRPYNLIRNLTLQGHDVTVATLWTNDAEKIALRQLKAECHNVLAEQTNRWQSLLSCVATVPTSKPIQAAYSWQPKLAKQIAALIKQNDSFDVIHVEHLRGSQYGLYLKTEIDTVRKKIPIVWDSVDCISLLFRQASIKSSNFTNRILTHFETNRTNKYEQWLAGQFDKVLVTSSVDKKAFDAMCDNGKDQPNIIVIPNGVDLDYFQPIQSGSREPATVVISGKMSYHANVAMVMHLVRDILPIVWSQNPEIKLWVVGKDPPQSIRKLAQNPAIRVTGMVDDIRPFLQNAAVAVAPVIYGAGIQNKVLEAMACGTPVVATSQAVSALSIRHERDALIADEPRKFAQSVLDLLNNPNRQREIGQAGRQYVEENHRWTNIVSKLEKVYAQVLHLQ